MKGVVEGEGFPLVWIEGAAAVDGALHGEVPFRSA
jgi:hypothetical protein